MNLSRRFFNSLCLFLTLILLSGVVWAKGPQAAQNPKDTLHLFMIGNSFSQNASRYLPELAKEGGHELVIGRAEIGGCPLKKHWELAELAEKDPDNPQGKPYKGKSLRMLLTSGKWDVVTLQQYSMHSADAATYMPYARKLYDFIKSIQPNARIVFHQTWAYRSDTKDFSLINEKEQAKSVDEMYQKSREAYQSIAAELGVKLIPVGDAFRKVNTSKKWGYKPDQKFDFSHSAYPALPNQKNSLHVGYYWDKDKNRGFDSHHANEAGCYLGGLVWYSFLFGESPAKLKFVPQNVPADFAEYLKKTAWSVTK